MSNLKYLVLIQAVIIIILSGVILNLSSRPIQNNLSGTASQSADQRLLSSRVYSNTFPPGSFSVLNFFPLKRSIGEYIKKNNYKMSVYVENFKSGAGFGINEKDGYLPVSITKVLVAIVIMRAIERGDLTLDTMVDIKDSDKLDTSGTLFLNAEKKMPLRALLRYMLHESDNTALRVLKRYVNPEDKMLISNYIGYYSGQNAGQPDTDEEDAHSLVTPKAIYNLFSSLYLSTILKPEHSEFILSSLVDSVFDIKRLAELPEDVTVAHKLGARYTQDARCFHDCGIMYIHSTDMRLFYCIMSKDLDEQTAMNTTAWFLKAIYSFSMNSRDTFDSYKAKFLEESSSVKQKQ